MSDDKFEKELKDAVNEAVERKESEKPEEDDLIFVDEESVKDKSKMADVNIPEDKNIKRKKTRRRTSDSMEIQKDKAIDFSKKYIHIIGIVALVVVVAIAAIVVAVRAHRGSDGAPAVTESSANGYEVNAHEDINELVDNYFKAYASGDVDTLMKYAYPVTDLEKEYIEIYSEYVEDFENITCYTKNGNAEGDYAVSVYTEVKFKDVKTPAPGLYFFYVRTDDNGDVYIDNTYSQYNRTYQELEQDPEITAFIGSYESGSDAADLLSQTQENYNEALEKDGGLKKMVETTIPDALADWSEKVSGESEQKEEQDQKQEEAQQKEEQQKAEQQKQEETQKEQQKDDNTDKEKTTTKKVKETVYATDNINIRQKPSTNAATVGSAMKGAELTRTAVRSDGWSQVKTGNVTGYVKTEFISKEKPAVTSSLMPGDTIYLKDTVNVRESMSENSSRIGVAYAGETLTIVQVYDQGWTRVNWNGQVGYVRTDVLQAM